MEHITQILAKRNNVNVNKNILNNVYDDNVASKIENAVDKPKFIGEDIAQKLNAPQNLRFYIKIARQYPIATIYECLALTNEAFEAGIIKNSKAQYFYGIFRKKTHYAK